MGVSSRFATPQEALSAEFQTISKAIERFHHRYQMPDHASVNRERMPWANGALSPPEFYASRLWEYPWAILAAELSPGLRCADIGGGTTPFPLYLREIEKTDVIIIDPDVGGSQEDHYLGHGLTQSFIRKANLKVLPDSMENISLPDESVDRVFCISVLEHIRSAHVWQKGLREMARILRPDGLAIVTVDLNAGNFYIHPFDILRYSGLILSGRIDLRMPSHRFGRMPEYLADIDVFGMVLKKAESPITLPYLVKKRFYYSKLCLHKFSNPGRQGIRRTILNKVYKAITHPDKAIRWLFKRALGILRFYGKWLMELTVFRVWHVIMTAIHGKPEITIIVVGRNDNYQGDFKARLETTLSWNLRQIDGEAIYVEWNPIPERPSDAEWLVKRFPNLRVYVVPPEIHESCSTNPNMPLMEYFAKNVGIRRARTPWICVMNADVAFGLEIINRLHCLRKEYLYGTNRVDLKWNGQELSNRILVNRRLHLRTIKMNKEHNYIGDFLLAHRDVWYHGRGYDESLTDRRSSCDRRGLAQLYHMRVKPHYIGRHFHLDHPETMTYGRTEHHGESFNANENLPYRNSAGWGLANMREIQIQDSVWLLKKT